MFSIIETYAGFNKYVTVARINKKKSHDHPTFSEWDHTVIRVKGSLVVSGGRIFLWAVSSFGWSGFTLPGFSFVLGFYVNHKTQSKI